MPNESFFATHQDYLNWYRNYREKNREKFRLYNREYNKQWRKDNGYQNEKNWKNKNPEKVRAMRLLEYAVRVGKIKRQPCEICGNFILQKSQGHHKDYSKPLEVEWFCALCHKNWHTVDKLKGQDGKLCRIRGCGRAKILDIFSE